MRISALLDEVAMGVRRDARRNMEIVLFEIAMNPHHTIAQIHAATSIPEKTIKNAQALLKELGVLCRVGGDFGGHWVVAWK